MINTAFVKIWENIIGAVSWDESQQLASFEYDKDFAKQGIELAPIKMPISEKDRIFSFPQIKAINKIGASNPTCSQTGKNPIENVAIEKPTIVIIMVFFRPNLSP